MSARCRRGRQRGRFPAGEITRGFAPRRWGEPPPPHLPRKRRPCRPHLCQQRVYAGWMRDLDAGPVARAACGRESCCVGGSQRRSRRCEGASGVAGVLSGVSLQPGAEISAASLHHGFLTRQAGEHGQGGGDQGPRRSALSRWRHLRASEGTGKSRGGDRPSATCTATCLVRIS